MAPATRDSALPKKRGRQAKTETLKQKKFKSEPSAHKEADFKNATIQRKGPRTKSVKKEPPQNLVIEAKPNPIGFPHIWCEVFRPESPNYYDLL